MSFVARLAAPADALAQASSPGARRRPMFQAQRALSATARPWRAAAPRGGKWDTPGWRPWGAPGIQQQAPPLDGTGEVIHEKMVA